MSTTLAELPLFLQDLFVEYPEEVNEEIHFCQRRRSLTPSSFVRSLVFGWLDDPDATPDDLAEYASTLGPAISGSAMRQQMLKPAAPLLLRSVLDHALEPLILGNESLLPVLQRFNGVHIFDTSIISLPPTLAGPYPGCGNQNTSANAACKVLFDLEMTSGGVVQLDFLSARLPDQSVFPLCQPLPPGALALRDLGFFSAQRYNEQSEEGVFWLSRAQPQLVVQLGDKKTQPLLPFLRGRGQTVDLAEVELGTKTRLRCRLIAWRVPDWVAARRKKKRQEQLKRKQSRRLKARKRGKKVGKTPSQELAKQKRVLKAMTEEQQEWCEWVVVLTNVPQEMLNVTEVQALVRARWQIEVLIKVWKQCGRVETLRGKRVERVECEVLAKILGQLVAHWAILCSGMVYLEVCVMRAQRKVKKFAERLGQKLAQTEAAFREVWEEMLVRVRRAGQRRRGHKRPSTAQRLAGLLNPWVADQTDDAA